MVEGEQKGGAWTAPAEGFKGYMHADAYPGYDKAFVPDGAIEVGRYKPAVTRTAVHAKAANFLFSSCGIGVIGG